MSIEHKAAATVLMAAFAVGMGVGKISLDAGFVGIALSMLMAAIGDIVDAIKAKKL